MSEVKHSGTAALKTPRLALRPYTVSDAQAVFDQLMGDCEITDQLDWQVHQDVSVTRRLLEMWVEGYQSPMVYHWCITMDDQPVGDIMVCKWNQQDKWCELGYCLARRLWGQGLMTEALGCVSRYLLKTVGFHRIQLKHEAQNAASGRVMQKCGYQYEGTLRQAKRSRSGAWKDICCYGLLASDLENIIE